MLRQAPEQTASRQDLAARLELASGRVVFTTTQKFEERGGPVSERANILVLADEAHRSQYSFLTGWHPLDAGSLPNATFVGFTGTPLAWDDRSTPAMFGKYAGHLRCPAGDRGLGHDSHLLRNAVGQADP